MLATIHRLLRGKRERLRLWIANLSFDRKHHTSSFRTSNSMTVHEGQI
jgi:hypothetical protein